MEAMETAQRITAEEYLALSEEQRWTQLIEGELVVSQPRMIHQETLKRLMFALDAWARAAPPRGTVTLALDVLVNEMNVYAPDILWYRPGRSPVRDDPPPYPLPDLAVEVRSPSTWRYDIGVKKSLYERHGLPELWLIDIPADEVLVFRRTAPGATAFDVTEELTHGDILTSPLLPAFALPLDALFA